MSERVYVRILEGQWADLRWQVLLPWLGDGLALGQEAAFTLTGRGNSILSGNSRMWVKECSGKRLRV